MGMIMTARMLTSEEMAAALSSDELLEGLLYAEDEDGARSVDVDKAWHAIHWLLTGSADDAPPPPPPRRGLFRRQPATPPPAPGAEALAVLGGEPVGHDIGAGPARLLRPEQVAAVAAALEPLDPDALASRVDLAAMEAADLYPGIWDEEDVYEEYVGPSYAALRDFYLAAAADGAGVLLAIQ